MASHTTGDGGIPPRDAKDRGLQRIMTVGGAYGTRNYTVKHLRDLKGQRVLTETLPFSVDEAIAAEQAGIDTMKVRFDPSAPDSAAAIRRAAPTVHGVLSSTGCSSIARRGGSNRLQRDVSRSRCDHVSMEPAVHRGCHGGRNPGTRARWACTSPKHLDRRTQSCR